VQVLCQTGGLRRLARAYETGRASPPPSDALGDRRAARIVSALIEAAGSFRAVAAASLSDLLGISGSTVLIEESVSVHESKIGAG
jgi:glycosyltransferase A (GT-A) superfamily protein (DUF2064 family)